MRASRRVRSRDLSWVASREVGGEIYFLSRWYRYLVLIYVSCFIFYYFFSMRLFIFLSLCLFSLPTFALFSEWGDGGYCTLPDGSFRDECMYMNMAPTPKMSPRVALQSGVWHISTIDGKASTSLATFSFQKKRFTLKMCSTFSWDYGAPRDRLILRRVTTPPTDPRVRIGCDTDTSTLQNTMPLSWLRYMVGSDTLTITTKWGVVIVWKKK